MEDFSTPLRSARNDGTRRHFDWSGIKWNGMEKSSLVKNIK